MADTPRPADPLPCKAGTGYVHFRAEDQDACLICHPRPADPLTEARRHLIDLYGERAVMDIEDTLDATRAPRSDDAVLGRLRALCSCPPDWLMQDGSHHRECIQTDIQTALSGPAQ